MEGDPGRGQDGCYDVVWPLGRSVIPSVGEKRMPQDLNGRTVAFVWDYLFGGDKMFEAIGAALRSRYPRVRTVGHAVFGNIHGSDEQERVNIEALPGLLREHRVDTAVLAVGA